MAKTKAELESDCIQHYATMHQVREAHQHGDFERAIELAVSAWECIDGMMQYERRYQDRAEFESIDSIDFVLRYGPLFFDFQCLDKLAALLKSQRRIEKNTTADLAVNLSKARALMWDAHRLWNHLELELEARQDELRSNLGGDQDTWRWMAETWEQMGLIQRTAEGGSYRLRMSTRLDDEVRGKCPSCGVTGKSTKARLLEQVNCPKCRASVHFVLLPAMGS